MGKRASGSLDEISSKQLLKRPFLPLKRPRKRKTQIQGPSLRTAKPRSHKLLRCSTAATQVRVLTSSLSWGAKRLRSTTRAGSDWANLDDGPASPSPRIAKPRSHKLLRCSAAATQVRVLTSSLSWAAKRLRTTPAVRDWANLDEGPASLIAELALANDVADYIQFRDVCLSWRRCSTDPRLRGVLEDCRFHPRRWIMLLGEREELSAANAPHCSRRHFLNVSTGQCIQVDVPELHDHGVLQSTGAEGLLVLLGKATGAVRLLNPLTRQMAELPPITGMGDCSRGYIGSCLPSTALVNEGTVFLCFYRDGISKLASAKPGDERWVLLDTGGMPALTSFAGRFYGISNGAVMVMDTTRGNNHPPQLVVAAKLARPFRRMEDSVHLVDNGGKLMLVHRMLRYTGCAGDECAFKRTYKVYHVNLDAGKTTPARGLGGCAIFLGLYKALSVSSQVFPSIEADSVYPGLVLPERGGVEQVGAYHLRDGSTERFDYDSHSGLPRPWSIADCLAAYVSS